jgi:C4-dicarboxylate transporter, DctQ subunit
MVRTIYQWMIKVVEVICIIAVAIATLLTGYEVMMRQLFGSPTIWTNEITSYLLVWFGLLGIVYAYDKKAHVAVDMIYEYLPVRVQRAVDILTSFLILLFSVTIFYYGYKYWWMAYSRGWQHVGMLDVPMSYTRIALPLVGCFMIFQLMITIYDQIRELIFKTAGK